MYDHLIAPLPPLAGEELPHVGAGLRFLETPTAYLQELRTRHGDTFLLDVFGFNLLMTFAPKGLETLYRLDETQASFGLATYDLIGFKTPAEIFRDADPDLFHLLLQHRRMAAHVATIDAVVRQEMKRWRALPRVDIFDAIRTLEQRVGYALWIAPEAAAERWWPLLKREFDIIGQESAFVDPQQALATIKSGKARERAAVAAIAARVDDIAAERASAAQRTPATLDFLHEHFAALDDGERRRRVAHNIVNLNQGFLSNLYAAIAWVIVRLLQHPDTLAAVRAEFATARARFGDAWGTSIDALNSLHALEQVTMESVRLAQRSLTLRKVVEPVQFDDGTQVYTVQPGVYIATMLSVTNVDGPQLVRFDPLNHYLQNTSTGHMNQLDTALTPAARETVSTFGHGRHACPAQRFSHHMCKIVVAQLLENFALTPLFDAPQPSARQMGGVARPDTAVLVGLRPL